MLCLLQSTSKISAIFKGIYPKIWTVKSALLFLMQVMLIISSTKLIATYNFASGSLNYQERARKRFLFGETVALTQNDMLKSIRSLVPTDRQVIFVTIFKMTYGFSIYLTSISRHLTK